MEESTAPVVTGNANPKSNLFRFVTVRHPQMPTEEELERGFIYAPAGLDDPFSKAVASLTKVNEYERSKTLREVSSGFTRMELSEVKNLNTPLHKFSSWLMRNRKKVDFATIHSQHHGVEVLDDNTLKKLWENLIYQTVNNQSSYTREVLIQLIVGDNFIKKHKNEALIKNNEDLRRLACARVVIPTEVVPKRKAAPSKKARQFSFYEEDQDVNEASEKLNQYQNTIEELQTLNARYVEDYGHELSSQPPVEEKTELDEEVEGVVKPPSQVDIQKVVGTPLSEEYMRNKISDVSISVIKDLKLSEAKTPVEAIKKLELEMHKISTDAFKDVRLTKKVVATGGSIIELKDSNKGISPLVCDDSDKPTIIDQVNLTINDASNYISNANTTTYSIAGGASQEVITGNGYVEWRIPRLSFIYGYDSYVGLSYVNENANFNTIDYALYVKMNPVTKALYTGVMERGVDKGQEGSATGGDAFRIERDGNSIKYFKNNILLSQAIETSPGEPLCVDITLMRYTTIHCLKFSGEDSNTGDGGTGTIPEPKMAPLGIADYRKVEQEVCCYVAGEVSHIENVLKGEYKKRSTRRLRRSESTYTVETEKETEKLRDTITTDRYEMEQETSQIIQEDTAFDLGVSLSTKFGPTKLVVDSSFATATSTTESDAQAVFYSQSVTDRAMERIVERVREERTTRIIEEFEENNEHGLDNRGENSAHVTGIYRWVDKIYKNRVVNYGKRLMYEFMIPQPAKFHLWAMTQDDGADTSIEKPLDPRESGLSKHTSITETNYAQWAAAYGAKVDAPPALYKEVSNAYAEDPNNASSFKFKENSFTLPTGYLLDTIEVDGNFSRLSSNASRVWFTMAIGDETFSNPYGYKNVYGYKEEKLPVSLICGYISKFYFNVTARVKRKPEVLEQWKIDTFNKILSAYRDQKAAYDNALAGLQQSVLRTNPAYNRLIEQEELKKSCLQWLEVGMGADFYIKKENGCLESEDMPILQRGGLESYASQVKFFEQAFEWDIMSYLFYPYYWGKECEWKELYRKDDVDPVFLSFLKSGMARVVVPVRPNYEEAVLHYMETDQIWNGGEIPTVNDPLHLSVVDELEQGVGVVEGEPWETRLPTTLTILQARSNALDVEGLPCFCDDYTGEATGDSGLSGGSDSEGGHDHGEEPG
ncbi:hypothetical protein KORDIASMS9_01816 [Kordia sp. SMS9]|uniref:hypothetical protein n=1 Tax=Kordia sp. SMS9 TaxID=2282170 RepID=UPI000E10274D|nr:hypothetical protein [Kordia sp. SMS9]AXG69591.1 hypothetical protein KORDIASMS9_01816 [Kordia sp. SMS9]